jgi:hypothetical protein
VRLLAIARAHVPVDIAFGVIHRDFCAENLVLPERSAPASSTTRPCRSTPVTSTWLGPGTAGR